MWLSALLEGLNKLKNGISKQSYVVFVLLGFLLIYYTDSNGKQEINKIAQMIGYGFVISGFLIAIITNILSIRIELYDNIIEKYKSLLDSSGESLDKRESFILRNGGKNDTAEQSEPKPIQNDSQSETQIDF